MTIVEVMSKLMEWIEHYGSEEESLNDFCNCFATSFEEYMALSEMLNGILQTT